MVEAAWVRLRADSLGYGETAILHDVAVDIFPGEKVVILGPSGAGKTTLLTALYRSVGGRAALIPQPTGLVEPLSVLHNIALGRIDQRSGWGNLRCLLWPSARERAEILGLADELELAPQLQQAVGSLSGGQQSRVAIGRALYRGGEILLADEPLAALDPRRREGLLALLWDRFATVVMTSHDVVAGLAAASRVIAVGAEGIEFDCPAQAVDREALARLYAKAEGRLEPITQPPIPAPRGCA